MSLKAFHFLFVIASILLGLGVGGWGCKNIALTARSGPW